MVALTTDHLMTRSTIHVFVLKTATGSRSGCPGDRSPYDEDTKNDTKMVAGGLCSVFSRFFVAYSRLSIFIRDFASCIL